MTLHFDTWTLKERRARADLIEVYKIIHGISSVSFDTFFEFNSYGTTRGHSLKGVTKHRTGRTVRTGPQYIDILH